MAETKAKTEAKERTFDEKIIDIQSRLNAPKSKFNKFGNYYYRSMEDILEAVKPLLKENGLILTIEDDIVLIGERYYVKATVRLLEANSGDERHSVAFAREGDKQGSMSESQMTGSASTYARKYALNGLFCIDDTKDDDTEELHNEKENRQKKAEEDFEKVKNQKIDEAKIKALRTKMKKDGIDEATILRLCKIQKIEDMTEALFRNITDNWDKVRKADHG